MLAILRLTLKSEHFCESPYHCWTTLWGRNTRWQWEYVMRGSKLAAELFCSGLVAFCLVKHLHLPHNWTEPCWSGSVSKSQYGSVRHGLAPCVLHLYLLWNWFRTELGQCNHSIGWSVNLDMQGWHWFSIGTAFLFEGLVWEKMMVR